MQHILSLKKPYLGVLVSFLLLFSLFFIAKHNTIQFNSSAFVSAITLDFAVTIPLIYLFLTRQSNIPKTTVVPLFILGLVLASYCLPQEQQSLLNSIKKWGIPIVEISVFTFIIIKVRNLIIQFKKSKEQSQDFFDALKIASKQLLPSTAANLFAMEIAVFYYGIFKWKSQKLKLNEFSYHKNSGTPTLLGALIFVIAIETVAIHLLVVNTAPIIAYILLALSIYSAFQILGFLKSLFYRPILITKQRIYLKYGILSETSINTNNIENVDYFTKDIDKEKNTTLIKLSPLGSLEGHNIIIHLKKEQTLNGLYGSKKQFQSIVLHLDDKTSFKQEIESLITQD
ncbi:hypothetical protein [uncultured Lacinutrix sp.]|uniref:hypothetical protein n=1 Tax=uncultured Lacinutrix sp. TaxID=574032 RepID=UPI002629E07B|nr:hypothetical protein [uncultured Lacinutrix sp.]